MNEPSKREKAVFDTGVILQSALSGSGPSFGSFRLMEEDKIIVVLSPQVREEYEDVLTRPAIRQKNPLLTKEYVQAFLARLDAKTQLVTVIWPYLQYPRDPNDELILSLAIQEQVDYIVTRDKDLLDLSRSSDFRLLYPYMRIVDPLMFVLAVTPKPTKE